jgi:hypothetical protein
MKRTLLAAIAAAGLLGFTASAQAVPSTGVLQAAGHAASVEATGKLETVSYACRYRHGYRYCGYVEPRVYSYYYAAPRYYRYGYRRH